MTASGIEREKYMRVMSEVGECEAPIAALEAGLAKTRAAGSKEEVAVLLRELRSWQEKLADASARLAALSNGCGKPHT